jgi:hypothetical protein
MIITPLLLKVLVAHYEKKTQEYLDGPMFKTVLREDTQVPLYLSIQTQSKPIPRLHAKLKDFAANSSLALIDQRSFYELNVDMKSVSIELYLQDTVNKVNLLVNRGGSGDSDGKGDVTSTSIIDENIVAARCEELREGLFNLLGDDTARIQVHRWYPHQVQVVDHSEPYDLSGSPDVVATGTRGLLAITPPDIVATKTRGLLASAPNLDPEPTDSNIVGDENYDTKMATLARSLLHNLDNNEWATKKISGERRKPRLSSSNVWEDSSDPRVKAFLVFQDFDTGKSTSEKLGGYIRKHDQSEKLKRSGKK